MTSFVFILFLRITSSFVFILFPRITSSCHVIQTNNYLNFTIQKSSGSRGREVSRVCTVVAVDVLSVSGSRTRPVLMYEM